MITIVVSALPVKDMEEPDISIPALYCLLLIVHFLKNLVLFSGKNGVHQYCSVST